jgi:hypothetical protein
MEQAAALLLVGLQLSTSCCLPSWSGVTNN